MTLPYRLTRRPDGARIITAPMRERASASVSMMFAVGSRYEDAADSGLSHFIEHMFFKGGRRYPTAKAVSEAIEAVGGGLNASTDKELTVYWSKVPAQHLGRAVEVLGDMCFHSAFDADELAKERLVVIEELRMYVDNPQDHVHTLFEEVMWPDHPLGRDTGGTEETVRGFERGRCLEHLARHYHPDRLVVSVAGAIDHDAAGEAVSAVIDTWGAATPPPCLPAAPAPAEPRLRFVGRRTEQANIVVGARSVSYLDADRFAVDVLNTILGEGMSSRLFVELREQRALAYDVHSFAIRHRDSGALAIYLGCEPRRARDALRAAVAELERLATEPVGEDELRKAREATRGRLALQLEGTSALASFLGQQELLTGEVLLPETVVARIDAVTAEQVREAARQLLAAGLRAAVIGPFRAPEKFVSLLAAA